MNNWSVEPVTRGVHVIRFTDIKSGWRQRVLVTGDRHHDNVHTLQDLEKAHLDKALMYNAPIIDLGDLYCLMQGKYDPRRTPSQIRSEHVGDDYIDLVQDTALAFYGPYANQFAVLGYGNHETAILKHNQVDVTRNLARRLKRVSSLKDRAYLGGYSGWIMFRFQRSNGASKTLKMKYHHGHGGAAPVTKGVIQTNRRAVYLPDASIVATAHIHQSWVMPLKRERISQRGKVFNDIAWHISTPTYKDEYGDGTSGWHVEGGRPPKPLGCIWLEFSWRDDDVYLDVTQEIQ